MALDGEGVDAAAGAGWTIDGGYDCFVLVAVHSRLTIRMSGGLVAGVEVVQHVQAATTRTMV